MIPIAALNGPVPKAGVVVVAVLAAVALTAPRPRLRATVMLGALVLAPVLLLSDLWNSPKLSIIHRHPLDAVGLAVAGLAVIGLLGVAIARRPSLVAPLVAFAFPFRIPIDVGGTSTNLLVPIYVVIGAAALAFIVPALRGSLDRADHREDGVAHPEPEPGWIERLLALYLVLYALQALYSPYFVKALQQMVFFYVPFAMMFCLLRRVRWTPRLLRRGLAVVVALALIFALIGFVEYGTKTLLLNTKLLAENSDHTYFAVNSVFYDPDIFGRFLALVMLALAAFVLYARRQRDQLISAGTLAVLWAGMVLTLSRSSLGALLVGLLVLGALRWRTKPILLIGAAVVVAGVVAVAISPTTFGLQKGVNNASAGRGSLVGGGAHLFRERPLWGYGSGSFEKEYLCRIKHQCGEQPDKTHTLSASHTIPVTIAAEQGLIGVIPYVALVVAALLTLLKGARAAPARAAVAAAFIALVFHTLFYADFLEDPTTWILLGIGVPLAYAAHLRPRTIPAQSDELAAVA